MKKKSSELREKYKLKSPTAKKMKEKFSKQTQENARKFLKNHEKGIEGLILQYEQKLLGLHSPRKRKFLTENFEKEKLNLNSKSKSFSISVQIQTNASTEEFFLQHRQNKKSWNKQKSNLIICTIKQQEIDEKESEFKHLEIDKNKKMKEKLGEIAK